MLGIHDIYLLKEKGKLPHDGSLIIQQKGVTHFLLSSTDTLRNSFIAFSNSKEALRTRVPAALLPLST